MQHPVVNFQTRFGDMMVFSTWSGFSRTIGFATEASWGTYHSSETSTSSWIFATHNSSSVYPRE